MQALEVRHFRRVACFHEGLKARHDQVRDTATKNSLLTEQVGFTLFLEGGFDDTGAAATIGRSVGQGDVLRVARGILINRNQGRHASTLEVLGADEVTGALGGDHDHVEVRARFDQLEVDVQTMGEGQHGPLLEVVAQRVGVEVCLQLIGDEHHGDIGPGRAAGRIGHAEAGGLCLGGRTRTRAQADFDVLTAGVLEVIRVGVALGAVTDDQDVLVLDQVNVAIAVVVNAHRHGVSFRISSLLFLCWKAD